MKITIVGAGPVGLLTACLLTHQHTITVIDKRAHSSRAHSLDIGSEVIIAITDYASTLTIDHPLMAVIKEWSNQPISTLIIEQTLEQLALSLGVTIRRNVSVSTDTELSELSDQIIIGADGANSMIRRLAFDNAVIDEHEVGYMAQLKYQTPSSTTPRKAISASAYSLLNGLTGPDMVVDFESLAPASSDGMQKSGTLHIPVPSPVYTILTAEGRGTHTTAWTVDELSTIDHPKVAKL